MYGSGAYKPLHLPKPRRRDRRAGKQSAHRHAVLRRGTGGRAGGRPPGDKRRALGRLLARYLAPRRGRWLGVLLALAATALVLIGTYATVRSDGPVPIDAAPAEYARLAELLAASCAEGRCGYGRGVSERPPAEAQRLMPRLRVRHAVHDSVLRRSTFRSSYRPSSPALVYQHPGPLPMDSASVQHRALVARWDSTNAAAGVPPRVRREPLGEGWFLESPR